LLLAVSFLSAVAISYSLLLVLQPLLARHALAKPNARSSHKLPTPQGGGIAVVGVTMLVTLGAIILAGTQTTELSRLAIVFASTLGLAVVGAIDDIRPLGPLPRLALQLTAVAAVLAILPADMKVFSLLPWWLDRIILLIGGVWLVNAVNFMDGIDWMTVAEIVPVTAAIALLGHMGALSPVASLTAACLCGAMIGFAPFNRPIARLFLGDVGSLPVGLLLGWLLTVLAGRGHLAAAILLPLYYLADATITLLCRLIKGEAITQAHRSHFYQKALDAGLTVERIVASVFVVNIALGVLALLTVTSGSRSVHVAALAMGGLLVAMLLVYFRRARL